MAIGVAPLAVLVSLSSAAGASRQRTVPPDPTSTTVAGAVAPAPTSTVAPNGEDTGLGPEVSTPAVNAPPVSGPQVQSAPIVAVPAGCPTPAATTAVFIGKVALLDFRTAQFTVESMRAGTLAGFIVGDQVQVRYGDDARFLDKGSTYIVGATPDPKSGLLVSKVREPEPLFGGDAVAGVDDSDLKCPAVEDPVMTLTDRANPVDTGLLTPLRTAKGALLGAVLRPLVFALAILVGLVLVKQLIFATGRALRSDTVTERTVVRRPRARRRRAGGERPRIVRRRRRRVGSHQVGP